MARFPDSADVSIKSESDSRDAVCSEDLERVPLKQRLKLHLASQRLAEPSTNIVVRNHGNQSYSQEEKIGIFEVQQYGTGEVKECVFQAEGDESIDRSQMTSDNIVLDKVEMVNSTSLQQLLPSDLPIKTKVSAVNSLKKVDVETKVKIKNETPDFLDELDFVVLKERRRMLKSRKAPSLERKTAEGTSPAFSSLTEDDWIKQGNGVGKGDRSTDKDFPMAGYHSKTSDLSNFTVHGLNDSCQREYSSNLVTSKEIQGNDWLYSSKETLPEQESSRGLDLSSNSSKARLSSAIVNVKVEPAESIELENTGKYDTKNPPYNCFLPVKREQEVPNDSCIDKLDHMLLRERMKLFSKTTIPSSGGDGISASLSKSVPSMVDSTPVTSAAAKPLKVNRPRKRRKTATDSVEEALEEDAPGLLKVILQFLGGVCNIDDFMDFIYLFRYCLRKVYQLMKLSCMGNLKAMRLLMICLQKKASLSLKRLYQSFFPSGIHCLNLVHCICQRERSLAIAWLVYFHLWSRRDIYSSESGPLSGAGVEIFNHSYSSLKDITEYGYATYFFELVESLPIHWQIKRLVTAMKLTSCSRISLIENRALLVGEDLTEGEAKVLMEYGWIRNTGLGSMLNYCDRVVHDRHHEKDSSEWRSKIGKMLVEGYNGGKLVLTDLPMNLSKDNVDEEEEDTKVKLELD